LFVSVLATCVISSSHRARDLAQGLGGVRNAPRGISLLESVAKWAANHAHNKAMQARKEKENPRSAAYQATKERGEDTPPPKFDEEEEEKVTPPPQSPTCVTPPPFSGIADRKVRIAIDECRSKQTQTWTGSMVVLPLRPHLVPVTFN
jgi:hypothetical protein